MQHLQNLDIEFVRSQFSALESGWAFLENAGGTLVSKQVVARVNDYMQRLHIQPNHYYGPSEEAGSLITKGQNVMADMIGATVEEVMIGPNTTANIFFLMQAIKNWFDPGDEIIVTNLDHEANNGSWRKLEEQGIVVKEWCFNCETGELEKEALEKLLTDKTRLVCFTHCSNITGTINDISALVSCIHAAGALACVDGVAYAPHRVIDVKVWDVDFYMCSLYKIFGPHVALLYAKKGLFERASNNNHYFLKEKAALKLNPGGPNHELTAGLSGIFDYFSALHRHHFGEKNVGFHDQLKQLSELVAKHEENISKPLVDFLSESSHINLFGHASQNRALRTPTFSFVIKNQTPEKVANKLKEDKLGIGTGNFYAARCVNALGWGGDTGGVLRASLAHYNNESDVGRLIESLSKNF